MNAALGIGLIAVYLAAVAIIGWRGNAIARDSDMFNIFGRRAGIIRATAGYLSLIGGGELITITQLGYGNGWGVIWFLGGVSLGFVALASLSARLKNIADRRGINTLAGYYADQFGAWSGYASTVIFVLSLGSLLTIQFIVGSELLSALVGIPRVVSIVVIGLVIISYLLPAGLVAVLSTDVLRAIMMSVVLIIVVVVTAVSAPGSTTTVHFDSIPQPDAAIYVVLGFFGAVAAADVWQTLFASKDHRVVGWSLIYGAVAFMAVGVLLAVLGMITRVAIPDLPADTPAFVASATRVVPSVLAPLVAVLVTGSVMATADTEIWVISTLLLSNLRPSVASGDNSIIGSTDDLKRLTRYVIPLVTVAAMLAAYLSADAQAIYTGLLSLLSASGPAIIAMIFLRPTNRSVALSLWSGLLAYLALSVAYNFDIPVKYSLLPLVIACVAYVIGAIFLTDVTRST
jgi:solute:Na+ symporter, SSS family